MAIEEFTKQSYEAYTIAGDFSENMATGETITSQTVTCIDDLEADVTSTILASPAIVGQTVTVLVQAGSEEVSPYIITFRVETSSSSTHKWEIDVKMIITET